MSNDKRKVYVVGHKNPDTDSICTAIAYANLKTKLTRKFQHYHTEKYVAFICKRTSFECH